MPKVTVVKGSGRRQAKRREFKKRDKSLKDALREIDENLAAELLTTPAMTEAGTLNAAFRSSDENLSTALRPNPAMTETGIGPSIQDTQDKLRAFMLGEPVRFGRRGVGDAERMVANAADNLLMREAQFNPQPVIEAGLMSGLDTTFLLRLLQQAGIR